MNKPASAPLAAILALSGDKPAAIEAAITVFQAAATARILHGSDNGLEATRAALAEKGQTKAGAPASTDKGRRFAAFVAAQSAANAARTAFADGHKGHKGSPNAAMREEAAAAAASIAADYRAALEAVLVKPEAARKVDELLDLFKATRKAAGDSPIREALLAVLASVGDGAGEARSNGKRAAKKVA